MRTNKYGVRGLKSVQLKRGLVYFWVPPVSLQKAGIFHHKTLGMDFDIAATRAHHWNAKLKAHRLSVNGVKSTLSVINLFSVAYLLREFEASPRFARYSPRTREDYSSPLKQPLQDVGPSAVDLRETHRGHLGSQLKAAALVRSIIVAAP
jgi:hypothetical protein